MNYRIIFTALLLLLSISMFAQSPELVSQKSIISGYDNYGRSISTTADGGFIVAGDIYFSNETVNYLAVKVTAENEVAWTRSYGGTSHETPNKIIGTNDGGFLILGYANSSDGDVGENKGWDDCWLVKIDGDGNLLWERSFGGSSRDLGNNILQNSDGSFYIAATSRSSDGDVGGNHGGTDYWLLKVSAEGNILWERNYGGSDDETFAIVKQLNNSGLLLFGSSRSTDGDVGNNLGGKDYWLVKTDSEGNLLWERNYGGSESDAGSAVALKKNGGFVLGGSSKSSDGDVSKNFGLDDYWLVSCDPAGNILWQRSYGGTRNDVLKQLEGMEGGYLLTGYSYSYDIDVPDNHGSSDMWVVKIRENGYIKWARALGGSKQDVANGMTFSPDFGYLIAGYTASSDGDVEESSENIDMWVVKLCEDYDIHQELTICTGDSLLWEGEYYKENSSAEKSFTSQCGKDSLRSMNLTVVDYPENFSILGDTIVLAFSEAIYSVPQNEEVTYIFTVINVEITDSIIGNKIRVLWGTYGTGTLKAVAVNAGGCPTDTAYLSVRIAGLGTDEHAFTTIKAYPNPLGRKRLLYIESAAMRKIKISDLSGRTVYTEVLRNTANRYSINLSSLAKGVYSLSIFNEDSVMSQKLVLE